MIVASENWNWFAAGLLALTAAWLLFLCWAIASGLQILATACLA